MMRLLVVNWVALEYCGFFSLRIAELSSIEPFIVLFRNPI